MLHTGISNESIFFYSNFINFIKLRFHHPKKKYNPFFIVWSFFFLSLFTPLLFFLFFLWWHFHDRKLIKYFPETTLFSAIFTLMRDKMCFSAGQYIYTSTYAKYTKNRKDLILQPLNVLSTFVNHLINIELVTSTLKVWYKHFDVFFPKRT